VRQFVEHQAPYTIVIELVQMGVDRKLLQNLGTRESENMADMKYTFTDAGRRWVLDALEQVRYTGPLQ